MRFRWNIPQTHSSSTPTLKTSFEFSVCARKPSIMPKFVVIERLGSSSCRNSYFHSKFSSSSKSSRKLHRSSRIFHNSHPQTHCYNLILLLTFFIVSNINLVVCLSSSSNGTQGNEPNAATTLIRKTTIGTTKRTLTTNLTAEKPLTTTTSSVIANANSQDACYASVRLTANNRSLQEVLIFIFKNSGELRILSHLKMKLNGMKNANDLVNFRNLPSTRSSTAPSHVWKRTRSLSGKVRKWSLFLYRNLSASFQMIKTSHLVKPEQWASTSGLKSLRMLEIREFFSRSRKKEL